MAVTRTVPLLGIISLLSERYTPDSEKKLKHSYNILNVIRSLSEINHSPPDCPLTTEMMAVTNSSESECCEDRFAIASTLSVWCGNRINVSEIYVIMA